MSDSLHSRRRALLQAGAVCAAPLLTPFAAPLARAADAPAFDPRPADGWRVFELTTLVEPVTSGAATEVWVPLPSVDADDWIRPMGNLWQGNAATVQEWHDPVQSARLLHARWDAACAAPRIEITSRVATRDRAVDLAHPGHVAPLDPAQRALYTRATRRAPLDGIVASTSRRITAGARDDLARARAIYEWMVDNTRRNPKVRGCGTGDIRFMLETGDLSGKCADISALFVGLARAAGLAARDVYGIRVADSRFGYHSLGKSGDVSHAQHCRAEVWLEGFGWVPVDPADVRKVVLEERPGLTLSDPMVVAARRTLFGAWEMNWVAYNTAQDLTLPGGPTIPFLMYPQGRAGDTELDSLSPETFAYRITARELPAGA